MGDEHTWIWVSKWGATGQGAVLETISHGYRGTTVYCRSCWGKKKKNKIMLIMLILELTFGKLFTFCLYHIILYRLTYHFIIASLC